MYNRFFGFTERPFRLVPNPAFLYLSRMHEEVLAHLNYAAAYGDGFVEVTGEVGTGKTTLCRMFLENLDEKTEAAYIFNPKLDALQLLKAINDEFGIASDTDSVKALIDRLNTFLLDQKAKGRRVLLLIDEAQNLSPDVLEQLRLLSNLETTTSKLLQIILVGQPELGEMLETGALRQLNQRITLTCHLVPLTFTETRAYIRHRIHVASQNPGLEFTAGAYRSIFRYSGGVPRLINIACDRALLTAYTRNKHRITNPIVKRALRELNRKTTRTAKPMLLREKLTLGLLFLLVFLVLGVAADYILFSPVRKKAATPLVHHKIQERPAFSETETPPSPRTDPIEVDDSQPATADAPSQEQATTEGVATAAVEPPLSSVEAQLPPSTEPRSQEPELIQAITVADEMRSRAGALKAVLKAWNMKTDPRPLEVSDGDTYFRLAAHYNNMEIVQARGNLNLIRKLNLPAIVEFPHPDGSGIRYLAVTGMSDDEVQLSDGEIAYSVPTAVMETTWNGRVHILWKNHFNYTGVVPINSPGDVILSLKGHLKALGYPVGEMNATYDIVTRETIERIQAQHGLEVDGMVGPQTKIVIYNDDKTLEIPRLDNALNG
ncbi:ATPase AAA [Desulfosarcina widdelii]|uniref:ATPase AAA n=1 Tax=Desulfosarcina widdelii TaxID=947919 RepID=A0A5K7Z9U0_9BACT|nr:AAA family ATPase [Desulfosarcina widdelii]BBO76909.1 ATPase AAA [Desulfosarcina widdelii]